MLSEGSALAPLADQQWSTEAEMVSALDELEDKRLSGERLIEACRTGSVEAAALDLDVDLAALNSVLIKLGPPYQAIDRTFITRRASPPIWCASSIGYPRA